MPNEDNDLNMDCVAEGIGDGGGFSETGSSADGDLDSVDFLRQQLQEAETKALRYQADLDNFRRRTRREVDEQLKYAPLPLMSELVDLLDNLHRALDVASSDSGSNGLVEGVKMVAAQFSETLHQNGCKPIEALNQKYDPNLHQAVQMLPHPEVPADHISHVFRAGYQLHDRVIRPSQVVVSTGPAS
jgi:molecular chaperone GrpE